MPWAQICILVFLSLSLLIDARDHGKPRTGNDSFWLASISIGIMFTFISFGGGLNRIFP